VSNHANTFRLADYLPRPTIRIPDRERDRQDRCQANVRRLVLRSRPVGERLYIGPPAGPRPAA
jgi:hypothetical protein